MWEETTQCELYYPERQVKNQSTAQSSPSSQPPSSQPPSKCGNGFQVFEQTECVVGNLSLPVQNPDFCPPEGFHVRSCFNWCEGEKYVYFTFKNFFYIRTTILKINKN